MSEADFDAGVHFFLVTVGPHREELTARCRAKYPALDGRCVNVVEVPYHDVGDAWGSGRVVEYGRFAISEPRLCEAMDGMDGEVLQKTRAEIADYDVDKHVLFMFICNLPSGGGTWVRWGRAGRND